MNLAEKKKLIAEANKLLRSANKKKKSSPKKSDLLFKVFTQTKGHFPPGQIPLIFQIKTEKDFELRNRQIGRVEYLENKTYFKANLKHEGIYFYNHMELVMNREFYYKAGNNGFISLTPDGKIKPISEEDVETWIKSLS